MITSFRCPPQIKGQIDILIRKGRYPDFSAFCVVALENQLLLEDASDDTSPSPGHPADQGPAMRRRRERLKKSPATPKSPPSYEMDSTGLNLGNGQPSADVSDFTKRWPGFSIGFLAEKRPFPLPDSYADIFESATRIPPDRFLFGQYNRLLPAKVSIRALSAIALEGRLALGLERVAPRIAELAAAFGTYLKGLDRKFGTHRDDALATAFPEEGLDGQKGRLRYQNHFVGHTVKGEQGGLLVGLKLATIQVIKNKPHILPTSAGWEFARLNNPLLDTAIPDAPVKFSQEEISFLLDHIRQHVPVERFAFQLLMSLIVAGRQTPESLTRALLSYLESAQTREEQRDFVSTQRTGLTGRMADLGLLIHERNGTRITYKLTASGKQFLDLIGPVDIDRSVGVEMEETDAAQN